MSLTLIQKLIALLLDESPAYRTQTTQVEKTEKAQRELLRALMNVRPPRPLSEEFLRIQDELLSAERKARGVVDVMTLPVVPLDARLSLWQGDITRLNADAIVNAANSALLGCFIPCHRCSYICSCVILRRSTAERTVTQPPKGGFRWIPKKVHLVKRFKT